jgi:hypothetical protein
VEKYTLKHPIQFGTEEIKELEIGRPKGRHLADLPGEPKLWDFIKIASKVSGLSIKVYEEMDAEDILVIGGIVGKFVAGSQATGS